jgi:phosphoglycolate phosphatase
LQKINLYFDFDGTLFDSQEGIKLAIKKTANEVYNVDCEVSNEIIGPPISIMHDKLFPNHPKKEHFVRTFRNYYDNTYFTYSKPYYKSVDFFSNLISINCNLNIVSNKPTYLINNLLVLNGIEKYFNYVSGNSQTNLTKKHRLLSLVKLENEISNNIVIGDTAEDYEMALHANCKFIFANYGYGFINASVESIDELDCLLKLLQK